MPSLRHEDSGYTPIKEEKNSERPGIIEGGSVSRPGAEEGDEGPDHFYGGFGESASWWPVWDPSSLVT
ncbi:Hypothetical predicted protein [Cloeon dipterum]|uniref:Uncharacterized protein n=1 Tax=Cloeon dipterum TaxID=197152 RepID=A0A8S1CAS2_9INSE|nr:Hypothetical predicted protein [Cloeon dipterum]